VRAFAHCDGVPHRIAYDNLKLAVARIIDPGKPSQNGTNEVFWGTFREKCFNWSGSAPAWRPPS
jgi:hypothetical protein